LIAVILLQVSKTSFSTKSNRVQATHMVRVGESEKSSTEMTRILNLPVRPRSFRQLITWILLIAGFFFIVFYLSSRDSVLTATGNKSGVTPQAPSPTYSVIH
jgi:hypothetical protein